MDKCPHCGDAHGVEFKRTEEFAVYQPWIESEEIFEGKGHAEHIRVVRETKPRCCACGKIVDAK